MRRYGHFEQTLSFIALAHSLVLGQEVVEDTGHPVLLVVDDEWDGQGLAPM